MIFRFDYFYHKNNILFYQAKPHSRNFPYNMFFYTLTLNQGRHCLWKQSRSRSDGFSRSHLIRSYTGFHLVCEFIWTNNIELSDWLTVRNGHGRLDLVSRIRVKRLFHALIHFRLLESYKRMQKVSDNLENKILKVVRFHCQNKRAKKKKKKEYNLILGQETQTDPSDFIVQLNTFA